ncbi:MAG TPA: amylo-alpha-1,6-glucosidase [Pyrinomonadaceae bacterium]|jgi:predicted glycogen debranching enzyme|nr:amylo-alpha-1,6-glucosidase [Pyrinomonadaceae bacterium]
MNGPVRKLTFTEADAHDAELMLGREWLVTNGLGGFASGTVAGIPTRRYHGLLISALPTPLGRTVMFNHLTEWLRLPTGVRHQIGGQERAGGSLEWPGAKHLREFRLEEGLPVWLYELGGAVLEKRVLLVHGQNTVHVNYRLVEGEGPLRLKLRPALQFRPLEEPVHGATDEPYTVTSIEDRLEVSTGSKYPPLRLKIYGERATFALDGGRLQNVFYRSEARRGYEHVGEMWSPGYFSVDVTKDTTATLVGSTEPWELISALTPEGAHAAEHERRERLLDSAAVSAREGIAAELVLAADQFVITPSGRQEDAARARAAGEEVRSVIAGYHWFTDWGRDTMISLEGLTCTTGRHREAGWILRTFGQYVRDGLIPNMFPDGASEGLYHTADATLWFFHALDRYLKTTADRVTLEVLLPKMQDIVRHHLEGTRFNIHVDPRDGLLVQDAEGYQLTWMDAKCDGWVVTPRRGKAVEINALWYNALRLLEGWTRDAGDEAGADELKRHADRCLRSFNERFWYEAGGHLFDVIESEEMNGGDDPACRPNQLLAISLEHAVLERSRWESVLNVAREKLLTPVGLRSLSPDHPEFKPTYHGDLKTRDAAYHQGTVWAWLIGPFIDAWLKAYPEDRTGARTLLEGFVPHLDEACVGSISEVFDAVEPYTARGCIAQAWSVAEVLRCWVLTSERAER